MRLAAAALASSLLGTAVVAIAADQLPPGVKRVCVPAADGRTWECGTTDDPPEPRPLAPRDSPAPPSFLAAPGSAEVTPIEDTPAAQAEPIERPSTDEFPDAPDRDAEVVQEDASQDVPAAEDVEASAEVAPAPVEEPAPEPAAPTVESAPEPVAETVEPSSGASGPPPFIAAPRPGYRPGPPVAVEPTPAPATESTASTPPVEPEAPNPAPVPEPEPEAIAEAPIVEPAATEPEPIAEAPIEDVAPESPPVETSAVTESPAAPEPEPIAETAPEPIAETAPEPLAETAPEPIAETAPAPSAPTPDYAGAAPLGTAEFLALPGAGHTVQIANAPSPAGFGAMLASLGIDPATAYALPIRREGGTWWTLVWSSFPDAASARAARNALPRAGVDVGYPRRISALQNELR